MRIWALSDLHLALGVDKPMAVFGPQWEDHHLRMAAAWDAAVAEDDLVIVPGDLSWGMKAEQSAPDLAWLGARPGRKVICKGNHDYWWPSSKAKLEALLPARTWAIKKNACLIDGVGCFAVRGGDFAPLTRYGDQRTQAEVDATLDREERELAASIADLDRLEREHGPARLRICLAHYPPAPAGSRSSRFTRLISAGRAQFCIYGHLHGPDGGRDRIEGDVDGVQYLCASCDQIGFAPVLLTTLE